MSDEEDFSFEDATPVAPTRPAQEPDPTPPRRQLPAKVARPPLPTLVDVPFSLEAEEYLLSCCFIDGEDSVKRCIEAGITERTFYAPANQIIYATLLDLYLRKQSTDTAVVAEELKATNRLDTIGGFAYLAQVSSRIPTTAQVPYFIDRVRDLHRNREVIQLSRRISEAATGGVALDDMTGDIGRLMDALQPRTRLAPLAQRKPSEFVVVPPDHPSVLLGNRYLNRGDGMILSGTSGMGKSSIYLQMGASWALGEDFHGMKSNGPLKSLYVQSEDSDGDIGEVWASLAHMKGWDKLQLERLDSRIRIVSDRINRGPRFIAALRKHIEEFQPDLVWINPLQAFMDGDVTESKDLGQFLREGLNGLNEPVRFGYIIIHHTTKPATGNDKSERLWHEVMYDMAGGAELINWARAIMSLRPAETEGQFKLVLAKRGKRAGVTKQVPQGTGFHLEYVTTLGLKHATGSFTPPGLNVTIPVIFWEACDVPESSDKGKGGRPAKYQISQFLNSLPKPSDPAQPAAQIHRAVSSYSGVSPSSFKDLLGRAADEGFIDRIQLETGQVLYRQKPKPNGKE